MALRTDKTKRLKKPVFKYDPDVDAIYIKLAEGKLCYTLEVTDLTRPAIFTDCDRFGNTLGIEVIL